MDVLVAVAAALASLALAPWTTLLPGPLPGVDGNWPIGLFAASVVVLLARRDAPVLVAAVVCVCAAVLTLTVAPPATFPLMVAVATVAVHRGIRTGWVVAGSAFVVLVVAGIVAGRALGNAPVLLLGLGLAMTVAIAVATRRQYVAALVDRAARLEREAGQEARLAVAAERARIAREMHDIVAHGITVMIRLADGSEAVRPTDPARADQAVRQVADVGRSSLADMRRLLGVLRDVDGAPLAPQPGTDSLVELVDRYVAAGLPAVLTVDGPLPTGEGAQLAVHRAVQESLTNALRYASAPTTVQVHVDASGRGVVVTVTDDGRTPESTPTEGSGRGLTGLRERAAIFGGTVDAGAVDGGGWRVRATFPEAS